MSSDDRDIRGIDQDHPIALSIVEKKVAIAVGKLVGMPTTESDMNWLAEAVDLDRAKLDREISNLKEKKVLGWDSEKGFRYVRPWVIFLGGATKHATNIFLRISYAVETEYNLYDLTKSLRRRPEGNGTPPPPDPLDSPPPGDGLPPLSGKPIEVTLSMLKVIQASIKLLGGVNKPGKLELAVLAEASQLATNTIPSIKSALGQTKILLPESGKGNRSVYRIADCRVKVKNLKSGHCNVAGREIATGEEIVLREWAASMSLPTLPPETPNANPDPPVPPESPENNHQPTPPEPPDSNPPPVPPEVSPKRDSTVLMDQIEKERSELARLCQQEIDLLTEWELAFGKCVDLNTELGDTRQKIQSIRARLSILATM